MVAVSCEGQSEEAGNGGLGEFWRPGSGEGCFRVLGQSARCGLVQMPE